MKYLLHINSIFSGEHFDDYQNVILGDQELLKKILLQHVVPKKLESMDLKNGMNIQTLAKNTKTILYTGEDPTIGGSHFTVRGSNKKAENGIIHAIDDLIYPYVSDEQASKFSRYIDNIDFRFCITSSL